MAVTVTDSRRDRERERFGEVMAERQRPEGECYCEVLRRRWRVGDVTRVIKDTVIINVYFGSVS